MRVLLLAQRPQRRGAEVFAWQLEQELRRQGHIVRLIFLYGYDGPAALEHGEDQVLGGNERSPFEKAPGIEPILARRMLREVDAFCPDVVQANGARTVKYGAFAALMRSNRAWKLVYRNIGNPQDWVTTPLHRAFYRRIVMPQLDGVVGVSEVTLEVVRTFYGLDVPMRHIPRGVDRHVLVAQRRRDDMRTAYGVPVDAPLAVYVGSLSEEKRIDRLLVVASRVSHDVPALHWWVVGDGALRARLEMMAEGLGLGDRVRFHGAQVDVASYLQAADMLVLTSDTEGMPGAVLEAGFMGLPVVATDVGGVRECVLDNESGFVVAREDGVGIADAVVRLASDGELRNAMGARGRAFVGEQFVMERVAAEYVEFWGGLVAGSMNSIRFN